ncbi:hypothetical protein N7457_002360 [Penicillium paradoxum]|uniref:uncharacterized protein n=1 Tax=Penicillium paradoxum TaxID=176176 RepID=UPI0025473BC8|nr:uncharacterized protein N7457_002360 [Penicillium paradoxum]KAJ5787370.1 hypothetical protein N7457_002360 [Penicillium paradoxum]
MSAHLNRATSRPRVLPRSRLGCKTCKIRRVKCGEEKPSCVRCTSTGRKCDFDGVLPSSTTSTIVNPLSLSPSTNIAWRERRAFAYYFEVAATSIGGGLDVDFWRTVVPQVCRHEPAVWDAIIAISALFESPQQSPVPFSRYQENCSSLDQNYEDALGWYSRSVSAVRQRIERGSVDIFVGLISCVLFICIEAIQGNADGALQLYSQGVQLILALRPQIASGAIPADKASLLEDTIVPIFLRLGAIALAISGAPIGALLRDTQSLSAQKFDSLRSAREAIVVLAVEIPLFESTCMKHLQQTSSSHVSQESMDRAFGLSTRLKNWYIAFEDLMNILRAKDVLSRQQIGSSALLLSYHDMLYVMLETCTSLSLTQFDAYLPNFQSIVENSTIALEASVRSDGTQPPFTFEISIGLPIWFTSLRCREPRTRRAALALLHRAPIVQGFYRSSFGASISQKVIELEELQAISMATAHHKHGIGASESTEQAHLGSDVPPNSQLVQKDMDSSMSTAMLIPGEVRIGPIQIFRPMDGLLPGTTQKDIAKWNRRSDNPFLQFSRHERNLSDSSPRLVYECVPLDI